MTAARLLAVIVLGGAFGCFESSGSGAVAGAGGAAATGGTGGVGSGGAGGIGSGATGAVGGAGAGAGAVGGTGAAGTGTAGTGAGGTGTGGTSGDVCADCCAGRPNPQCAVVLCACPPIGGAGSGGTGAGTGGGCAAVMCSGFDCCGDGECVNLQNDVRNCGTCGNVCTGDTPYCDGGTCGTPPCDPAILCTDGSCCGTECCAAGEICCTVPGPVAVVTACVAPTSQGTCPMGCVLCDCNAPDTPIATPDGERPIASLREGDLVYSVEGEAVVVVPIAIAVRNPVNRHEVVRMTLEDGTVLEVSAGHPLVDGRRIGDLRAGADAAGVGIREVDIVPYVHAFTHDILPASRSGAYYAGGILLRSTLSP